MANEDYPIIDTTFLDSLVSSYANLQIDANPSELLETTKQGFTVDEEMLEIIRFTALKLSGKAILGSAQFAIGLDDIDNPQPSISVADGACNFAGRVVDVAICDFTDAMSSAQMLANTERRALLPGIIFETDAKLEEYAQSLGIVSLAPYCAVLPSSAYQLRHIPFAA